jgi:cellulose synthase/poly-beta-1,6-N-acetylglucosamine synthase-like glycosyltransferase
MVGDNYEPSIPRHVFEDQTGRRLRRVSVFFVLVFLLVTGFATEFVFRVYHLQPTLQASPIPEEHAEDVPGIAPGPELTSIVTRETAYTNCGQGLFNFTDETTGIAGYVPFNDPAALAGLRAHCSDLDTVYYHAFSFGTRDGTIRSLYENGTFFPLPAFNSGYRSRNRPSAFPVLTPAIGTPLETLEQIFDQSTPANTFLKQLETLDLIGVEGGFCIDLSAYPYMRAEALLPVFEALNRWLNAKGLRSCLIGNIDAEFWASEALVDLVGQTVLLGFQTTNSPSLPIAPQNWFDEAATLANTRIPVERLSFALGSFSTVWKSGQRSPEHIPFSKAMLRANTFAGTIGFSAESGSTHVRYLDDSRRLNQIWVLDAVSFHNQRTVLGNGAQTTIWPLGYEDPAIWDLVDLDASVTEVKSTIEAEIDLSNYVAAEGTGPFSIHIAHAAMGRREVKISPENERIITQTYSQIPTPQQIQLFGDAADMNLSIVFYGLGDPQETETLLNFLEQYSLSATFFLSTVDLLSTDTLVQDLVLAGHTVGTTITPRASRSKIPRFITTVQNNLKQQLLRDKFGYHTILVQNPSRYGQYPEARAVLDQLQSLQISGYLPVTNNITAPDGTFDPSEFVTLVRNRAALTPVNVLGFNFSRQNDRTTNRVLPVIFQKLVNDGFTFTTIPEMAGLETKQIQTVSDMLPAARDRVIYWLMAVTLIGVRYFILLLALIVALRSPVLLILAFLRRDKFPFDSQYLPPVTVIVPAYNEVRVIKKTLKSILASDYPDLKIVVVDDGSTDHTADLVSDMAKSNKQINLIKQENRGKWFAEDHALKHVETPVFVIVDADTLLHQNAIKHLVQPFCDDIVGAVAGTVEIGNRDNLITACQVVEYTISQNVVRRAYEVFNGILVVPGAIGAWRTKAVIESGYVSGDTITEDADLTVAVHRAGYKVMYAPEAKSYTEAPNSVAAFMRQRLRWSLGMLQIAWKHKKSISEGYAVGFISIIDLVWYRIISSFIYPLVDLILISTLFSWSYSFTTRGVIEYGDFSVKVVLLFALLTLLDVFNLAAAFWFERKFEWKLLFLVPLLRFGYRQLLYISSLRSIYQAVSGRLTGWQKLVRTDTATMRD